MSGGWRVTLAGHIDEPELLTFIEAVTAQVADGRSEDGDEARVRLGKDVYELVKWSVRRDHDRFFTIIKEEHPDLYEKHVRGKVEPDIDELIGISRAVVQLAEDSILLRAFDNHCLLLRAHESKVRGVNYGRAVIVLITDAKWLRLERGNLDQLYEDPDSR